MTYSTFINKEVAVTSLYFGTNGNKIKSYPKKIEYNGRVYTFNDGLQLAVNKGNNLIKIFCMNDGIKSYRIMQNVKSGVWTLQSIVSTNH